MKSEKIIKPKLLRFEELVRIYEAYNATDQIFEGSPITELFSHITALTKIIKEMKKV